MAPWSNNAKCLPNVFYGTTIPTSILVFKKCRTSPEDILFIDASKQFTKGKNQNRVEPQHIEKIITAYKTRQFEDKFSYVAPLSEIAKFRTAKSLQKFASIHSSVHNHFNQERHLFNRQACKLNRSAALAEWKQLAT